MEEVCSLGSFSPLFTTLPNARLRLERGAREAEGPSDECQIAQLWAVMNTPESESARVPLDAILGARRSSRKGRCWPRRKIMVAAATVQWLATNVGSAWVRDVLQEVESRGAQRNPQLIALIISTEWSKVNAHKANRVTPQQRILHECTSVCDSTKGVHQYTDAAQEDVQCVDSVITWLATEQGYELLSRI